MAKSVWFCVKFWKQCWKMATENLIFLWKFDSYIFRSFGNTWRLTTYLFTTLQPKTEHTIAVILIIVKVLKKYWYVATSPLMPLGSPYHPTKWWDWFLMCVTYKTMAVWIRVFAPVIGILQFQGRNGRPGQRGEES